MKKDVHPKYETTMIRCACGNAIETRSTKPATIQVDVCSNCHPFFTGQQKFMDTAGRIDRFTKKFGEKITGTKAPVLKKPTEPVKIVVHKSTAKTLKDLRSKEKAQSKEKGEKGKEKAKEAPKK